MHLNHALALSSQAWSELNRRMNYGDYQLDCLVQSFFDGISSERIYQDGSSIIMEVTDIDISVLDLLDSDNNKNGVRTMFHVDPNYQVSIHLQQRWNTNMTSRYPEHALCVYFDYLFIKNLC